MQFENIQELETKIEKLFNSKVKTFYKNGIYKLFVKKLLNVIVIILILFLFEF